jgi:hypothetical protein
MSNKKEKINILTIPEDKSINITIGGLYYQRLNKLLIDFGDSVPKKRLLGAMYKIKRGSDLSNDHYAFNLETVMILLHNVETIYKEKGLAVDNEVEIEVPEEWNTLKDDFSQAAEEGDKDNEEDKDAS